MCFDNWSNDLVDLGFATRVNEGGDIYISNEQMGRILNLDETCLSSDGGLGDRVGRPEVTFFNPKLPQLGTGTSKSALTSTLITGSNALGQGVPPHFQYPTSAKTEDTGS